MRTDPAIDRRAARIAELHFGYLTRAQALEAGLTPDALRSRIASGRLERVNVRLYRIPGAPLSWQGAIYAATAAAPPGSLASAISAGALFGVLSPPVLPHIDVRRGATPRGVEAVVHQATIAKKDRTAFGVIPTVTPARMLVECAALLTGDRLAEAVDATLTGGLATALSVEAAIARAGAAPGRKGIPALRAALEVWQPGIEHDSVAEARLFRLLAAWGFPAPQPLLRIVDREGAFVCEVDAGWPDQSVALDYDSVRHHGPRRWATDERRARAATELGWTFLPVDKSDLQPGGHDRFRGILAAAFAAPVVDSGTRLTEKPAPTARLAVIPDPAAPEPDGETGSDAPELRHPDDVRHPSERRPPTSAA